jgi:hypothetical protein
MVPGCQRVARRRVVGYAVAVGAVPGAEAAGLRWGSGELSDALLEFGVWMLASLVEEDCFEGVEAREPVVLPFA